MNVLIIEKGVYRTAPATPGLLTIQYHLLYLYCDERKYTLSPREIRRPKPGGFPEGSGYISS